MKLPFDQCQRLLQWGQGIPSSGMITGGDTRLTLVMCTLVEVTLKLLEHGDMGFVPNGCLSGHLEERQCWVGGPFLGHRPRWPLHGCIGVNKQARYLIVHERWNLGLLRWTLQSKLIGCSTHTAEWLTRWHLNGTLGTGNEHRSSIPGLATRFTIWGSEIGPGPTTTVGPVSKDSKLYPPSPHEVSQITPRCRNSNFTQNKMQKYAKTY